jgi:hypothetical protein
MLQKQGSALTMYSSGRHISSLREKDKEIDI